MVAIHGLIELIAALRTSRTISRNATISLNWIEAKGIDPIRIRGTFSFTKERFF